MGGTGSNGGSGHLKIEGVGQGERDYKIKEQRSPFHSSAYMPWQFTKESVYNFVYNCSQENRNTWQNSRGNSLECPANTHMHTENWMQMCYTWNIILFTTWMFLFKASLLIYTETYEGMQEHYSYVA